jgi:hypothetical protein
MMMPTKSVKSADTSKPAGTAKASRPATRRRSASPKTSTKTQRPDHREIAERAYYIHLEHGSSDEVTNWLRAERELTAA